MWDDLQSELGIKLTPDQKISLKELARRKNDTLRVYNPMSNDYVVFWGIADQTEPGGKFMIPGKDHDIGYGPGLSNQPRFIATKFFKEAANLILQSQQRQAIDKENARRIAAGFAKLDRQFPNDEESNFLIKEGLIISQDKYWKLLPTIILGVVHEWGLDTQPLEQFQELLTLDDLRAITDRPVADVAPQEVGTKKLEEAPTKAEAPQNAASDTPDPLQGVEA